MPKLISEDLKCRGLRCALRRQLVYSLRKAGIKCEPAQHTVWSDGKRVRYYFEKMIDHLNTYSPEAKVFVFIHKWDLVPKNLTGELYNEIRSYLFENVDPSYQESNIRVYNTSVFNQTLTKPMLEVFTTAKIGEFL